MHLTCGAPRIFKLIMCRFFSSCRPQHSAMATLLEQAQACAAAMLSAGPNMKEADKWLQQMILTQEAWCVAP